MKLSSENIHQALLQSFPQGLTVKELLLFLGQKKNKKTLARKCLKKLAQKNLCKKKDNHYYSLPGKALKKKKSASGESRILVPTGVYLVERGKGSVQDYRNRQIYFVEKYRALIPLHGDEVNFQLIRGKNEKKLARITEIVARKTKFISGRVSKRKGHLYFKPAGKQFPDRFLVKKTHFGKGLPTSEVQLEITRYPSLNVQGEGILRSDSNKVLDEEKILLSFLRDHKVPPYFPKTILSDCEKIPKRVLYSKTDSRVDLRHLQFVTIDGKDAKDFDDAIYAEQEAHGYRIWISIADVAEYVTPNSKIDKEAFSRGTSVYLPGKVYPMLPEALSNHLCSLREDVNRKTLTCEINLNESCEVIDSTVYESLVKIRCRLTYEELDKFFKTGDLAVKPSQSFLRKKLTLYKEISQKLLERREIRGAIKFSFPENQFVFDENGKIIDVRKKFQTFANSLVEQFMLEANENIGKFCDFNALPILWRNHSSPKQDKISDLKSLFWQYKQKIPKLETSFDFNKILSKIQNSPHKDILEYSLLRVMSQARYETVRSGHFGLGATHYCHFTSPIRRYPDLIVHRALKNFLHGKKRKVIPDFTSIHCSAREREAVKVERKAVKLKKALLMKDKVGNLYDLKVSGLHWNGIFVEIEQPYVEGFIPFHAIGDDRYVYDEENQSITGKNRGKEIMYGSSLKGILQGIDWRNFSPEFNWISWT